MTILIIILVFTGLFCFFFWAIDRAEKFFHPKKEKHDSFPGFEHLPDDGAGEYLDNFKKLMEKEEDPPEL